MKKLQIILTNPCSAQWDDMALSDKGRYCENCEKHILDLTAKTDTELIQFFKKKPTNVCGRLLPSQLNRDLISQPSKMSWRWMLPFAVGATMIKPAQANNLKPVLVQNDSLSTSAQMEPKSEVNPSAAKLVMNGTVLDSKTGKPLEGVKIRQNGFGNVLALTDSLGKYKLSIADDDILSTYTFDLIGYSRSESTLNNNMVVKLSEYLMLLGSISTINLAIGTEPLYYVYAGKKGCTIDGSEFKAIPQEWIKQIEVLNDAKSTALFGSKGINGVIMVEIKSDHAKKINFSKKK